MLVKLSSKGQIVIPKEIRQSLGLKAGDELRATRVNRHIELEPVVDKRAAREALEALTGMFQESGDLLANLEKERKQEIERDDALFARYVGAARAD